METKVNLQAARKHYSSDNAILKTALEEILGRDILNSKITDRIKTFEDACAELGISPGSVVNNSDSIDEAAYKKIKIIARALNEGWIPDWSDSSQLKYYPWFVASGSGFRCGDYDYRGTDAFVGSRLCFKSVELARYAGTQFIEIYNDFLKHTP